MEKVKAYTTYRYPAHSTISEYREVVKLCVVAPRGVVNVGKGSHSTKRKNKLIYYNDDDSDYNVTIMKTSILTIAALSVKRILISYFVRKHFISVD